MNIHQHVNEMVIEFIKQHLNNELKKIGDEFDISHEDLSRVLNLNTDHPLQDLFLGGFQTMAIM